MEEKKQKLTPPQLLVTACNSVMKQLQCANNVHGVEGVGCFWKVLRGQREVLDRALEPCYFHILIAFQNYQPKLK